MVDVVTVFSFTTTLIGAGAGIGGQAGAGASGSYDNASANITKEQFNTMSATDRLMLFKQNPNLYKELDNE